MKVHTASIVMASHIQSGMTLVDRSVVCTCDTATENQPVAMDRKDQQNIVPYLNYICDIISCEGRVKCSE